jgi:hypothetical protein
MSGPFDSETHIPPHFVPDDALIAQVSREVVEQAGIPLSSENMPRVITDLTRQAIRQSLRLIVPIVPRPLGKKLFEL